MIWFEWRKSIAAASCRSKVFTSDARNGSGMSSCSVLRSCSRNSMTSTTLRSSVSSEYPLRLDYSRELELTRQKHLPLPLL
jgi:hypothetical protein